MNNTGIKYGLNGSVILISLMQFFAAFFPVTVGLSELKLKPDSGNNFHTVNSISSNEPDFISGTDYLIIPMKLSGRLFLIEANVDGISGNFVFDTGSERFVLNRTYFRNYIKTARAGSVGITGDVGSDEQITVEKIECSGLLYKNLHADLASLGHIENRTGNKILGLIGFGQMKNLEIIIDPVNSELILFKIDKNGMRLTNAMEPFKADYSQKIESKQNILFLKGTIGGMNLKFCLDTGAETNVICSDCNKNILNTLTITRRASLKGAGTAGSEVLFGRMNEFSIGNNHLPNMEAIITNLDALSEVYGTQIDGMLGYSFLKNGVICVNFVKKQFGIRFMKGEVK